MTGSVVTLGKKKNDSKKRGADKENVNVNKRARVGAGKANQRLRVQHLPCP